MATRQSVYQAVNGERDYLDKRWGRNKCCEKPQSGGAPSTVDGYVAYITGYVNSLADDKTLEKDKLDIIRKIAGLCIDCMEQHGAPERGQDKG